MSSILQGTTPTLTIVVDQNDLLLSNIAELELTFNQTGSPTMKHLADVSIDTEANTVSYHFTQEETLAMNASRDLKWQIRFLLPDSNVVGTTIQRIDIANLMSDEVMT